MMTTCEPRHTGSEASRGESAGEPVMCGVYASGSVHPAITAPALVARRHDLGLVADVIGRFD
jgi:hypothetical protein